MYYIFISQPCESDSTHCSCVYTTI